MKRWTIRMRTLSESHLPNYEDPPSLNGPETTLPVWEAVPSLTPIINQGQVLGSVSLIPLISGSGICFGSTWIGLSPPALRNRALSTFAPSCTHPWVLCSLCKRPSTDWSINWFPPQCTRVSLTSNTEFVSGKQEIMERKPSHIPTTPARSLSHTFVSQDSGLHAFTMKIFLTPPASDQVHPLLQGAKNIE